MEKHINLIWKSIDNDLNVNEKILLEELLSSDEAFIKLYNHQVKLNASLRGVPLQEAPSDMIKNIMTKVHSLDKSYLKNYSSFDGIKVIGIAAILALLVLILVVNSLENSSQAIALDYNLLEWFNSIDILDAINDRMMRYSSFAILFIMFLGMVGMDFIYKTRTAQMRLK